MNSEQSGRHIFVPLLYRLDRTQVGRARAQHEEMYAALGKCLTQSEQVDIALDVQPEVVTLYHATIHAALSRRSTLVCAMMRFLPMDHFSDPGAPDSDWSKEAARMQDVFSSAVVTISATSATDWRQGFCGSTPTLSRRRELSEHGESSIQQHHSRPDLRGAAATEDFRPLEDNDFKRKVNTSPLNQRAWVLQERVLSRRLIHFTEDSTYWECGERVRCDDFRELRW